MIRYKGRRFYRYHTQALPEGQYMFVVRSVSAGHVESTASPLLACQVVGLEPEAPVIVSAEAM
ncbi:MAG: hypothetical protein A2Y77_12575 [Planctomycetes bacterium RBG_13_62_9]|nr:MAG: hypothetical protein A2Y77_12575 [Planctomycetes bacterium RBG_13_62_9]